MPTIKSEGDAQAGRTYAPNKDDILYLLQSDYTGTGDDSYIHHQDLIPDASGDRTIYNAITDGGIDADYTDRLNPGTDQNLDIIAWIETNGLPNGKRRFFFPAGHYQISVGGTEPTNLDVNGYDDVEIFGAGMDQTFFHYKQDYVFSEQYKGFLRIGWTSETKNCHVHDFSIVQDPYATYGVTDGTAKFGWVYIKEWSASEVVEKGDRRRSTADDYIIQYSTSGTTASTEPSWTTGTVTDGGCTVVVTALANRVMNQAYSLGDHYKTTTVANEYQSTRGIARCTQAGTTHATVEPTLARPSADGAGVNTMNNGIACSYKSVSPTIERVRFKGIAGLGEAGGTAIGVTNDNIYGARIRECRFEEFSYGTAIAGYGNGLEIIGNYFYKTGGWGYQYGTYNAHGMYIQGGNHLIAFNKFDSHYYGLDIKVHNNAVGQDLIGTRLIGNIHLNYGWSAVEILDPDTYTVTGNQNFIPQYSGIQSGTSATVMTDSARSWSTNSLVGYTVYNTTDGSSGTITANTGTTVTVTALAGGTGDTWDANDLYQIGTLTADEDLFVKDSGTNSGTSSTVLTDSSKSWSTDQWVGYTVFNRTDGSSGRITANAATTITVTALAGGSDNSWDADDLYDVGSLNNLWTSAMSQMLTVVDCHFRIERSVYNNWNDWGGTPGDGFAIAAGSELVTVTGCTFMDTYGLRAYLEDTIQDYDDKTVTMMATGCTFGAIFRSCSPMQGAVRASDSSFNWRARDLGGSGSTFLLDDYASLNGCRIFANAIQDQSRYSQLIEINGKHVTIENCLISVDGTGYLGFHTDGAAAERVGAVFRNNKIIAPNAVMHWYPGDNAMVGWLFEGNYWDIAGWDYLRKPGEGIVFRNERGNLWGNVTDLPTGDVVTVETTAWQSDTGTLVDKNGAKVTAAADIYGVLLKSADNTSPYGSFIAINEKTVQWIDTTEAVAAGDWVTLSSTAGKVELNGTTGSTTKPTSGFVGLVLDAGTATAGAGKAQIEIWHFNLIASAGSYTHPNHTGDVTSVNDGATTIANNAVTLAKMADMATDSLLGRTTAATGDPEVLSASAVRTLLGVSADTATRLNTLWIPATAMNAVTTNGASPGSVERASNDVMVETMDFDTATHQYAQFAIAMPKSWNEGTLTARFYWTHPSTTTNFGVVWEIQGFHLSNDDATDGTWGTLQEVQDTGGTTDDLYISSWSSAITPNYTAVQDDLVYWRVGRQVADDGDDMAVDAQLIGVVLRYTSNNITDT